MSYTHVWEFQVSPGFQFEFEQHYRAGGTWARLFASSAGYIETILLKDRSTAGRYLTLDRWRDEAAFHAFRSSFSREYEQLDQACERLTAGERLIGMFTDCAA